MIRTLLLGALGIVAAIAVGIGIHLVTRDTIALPVVRLEQAGSLAPPRAPTTPTTGATRTGSTQTETETETEAETETDDGGSGRGRGRGRGGDD